MDQRIKAKTSFRKIFLQTNEYLFQWENSKTKYKNLNRDMIEKSGTHWKLKRQSKLSVDNKIVKKIRLNCFHKENIKCKRPKFVGFCMLKKSKIVMYEGYYNKSLHFLSGKFSLLHYMNKDSFIFSSISMEELIKVLKHFQEGLDLSEVDQFHDCYSMSNETILGRWNLKQPQN